MVTLQPLDVAILVVFIGALLALGFSARLRDNSLLQYLAAGRSLSLAPFVATLVCTWYGGILGIGESVSFYGFGTLLMLGVPYYVFALLYARFLAARVRGFEEISLPERLRSTFGRGAGLFGALLVFLLAIPSAHVLMLGILVELFTGWTLWVSVAVAALGGSLFLYRGGLLADVRASLLAFGWMYLGFLVIVVTCLQQHPPAQTFAELRATPLGTWNGGQSWTMILSFFVLGAWTMVDPGFHQRVASASSPQVGQRGVTVSVLCWFLFDLLSITTGLYAVALLKEPPTNMLMAFPLLGEMVLPSGWKAVFLCGIFGTVMCAMVGYALVSGATFGRDLVGVLKPSLSEPEVKRWTRIGIAVGIAGAVVLGTSVASVVQIWYSWGGVVTGALLLPVLLAYVRPASGQRWVLISMVVSFLTSLGWWIYGSMNQNPFLLVGDISLGTLIPGLAISATILGLGSLVARREQAHG